MPFRVSFKMLWKTRDFTLRTSELRPRTFGLQPSTLATAPLRHQSHTGDVSSVSWHGNLGKLNRKLGNLDFLSENLRPMAKQTQKDSLHDCVLLVLFFYLTSAVLPLPSQYLMPCGIDLRPLQQQNAFSHFFFLAYLPGTVPCFLAYLLGSRAASSFLRLFSYVFLLIQLLCLKAATVSPSCPGQS